MCHSVKYSNNLLLAHNLSLNKHLILVYKVLSFSLGFSKVCFTWLPYRIQDPQKVCISKHYTKLGWKLFLQNFEVFSGVPGPFQLERGSSDSEFERLWDTDLTGQLKLRTPLLCILTSFWVLRGSSFINLFCCIPQGVNKGLCIAQL